MLPEANAVLAAAVLEPQLPVGCGARIVAHAFPVPGWQPEAQRDAGGGVRLYRYRR